MTNKLKDTSSKKQGKASTSKSDTADYKYSPKVETPNPKASNKANKNEAN